MKVAWRWFGQYDPITLQDIKEVGAQEVVTALHDIPCGQVWSLSDILSIKDQIEAAGLSWSIVESLAIHEDIKQNKASAKEYIDVYIHSMENLAQTGIKVICYNFMPVTDWTRTSLFDAHPSGSLALAFDYIHYVVYDLFMLNRENAAENYTDDQIAKAQNLYDNLSEHGKQELIDVVGLGLPGTVDNLSLEEIRSNIAAYKGISDADLRHNLISFLKQIMPHAERLGIKMAIHPDDPPLPLFGLPRIISSYEDIHTLFEAVPSPHNGLTLCTGSLGAGKHNDVVKIAKDFTARIYFAHLRSVKHKGDYFAEAPHLEGDQDLGEVIGILLKENDKRVSLPQGDPLIFRPDHGHLMLSDKNLDHHHYYPGYSLIGRMKALAELRGIIYGITHHSRNTGR